MYTAQQKMMDVDDILSLKKEWLKMAESLGHRLLMALTETEIAILLDGLLTRFSRTDLDEAIGQLPVDTQQTIRRIVMPPPANDAALPIPERVASIAKLAESWSRLWDEWYDIIAEAAQEEGAYITQEEQWEEPYFDEYALVEDLEKVAAKMLPLVQTAYENRFEPDTGFGAAIIDAEDEISIALPEWIEITNGFELQENLTLCLLTWEWLLADEEQEGAFGFVQRVRQWEEEFGHSGLDRQTLVDFCAQVGEADQRSILEGISAHKQDPIWKLVLGNTFSPWHGIYTHYLNRYAPERFLDQLRIDIPQEWQAGLPVLADLLKRQEYGECLAVAREMTDSLVRSRTRANEWTPQTGLLFSVIHSTYNSGERWTNHQTLLYGYQKAAQEMGQSELAQILTVQLAAFDHFYAWENILVNLTQAAIPNTTRQALFQSWRDRIALEAKPYTYGDGYGFGRPERIDSWWVHWLLDSHFDPGKGSKWFQQKVDGWLLSLAEGSAKQDENFGSLRLLTQDLAALDQLDADSLPRFFQYIIRPRELSTQDESDRQRYLAQSMAEDLGQRVTLYWRQRLRDFVPDPQSATKSEYSGHAQWMAALQEVNPDAFGKLLQEWRTAHQRRRNLWKAMEHLHLN